MSLGFLLDITKPRKEIWELIKKRKEKELLKETGKLHGHFCPFVSLGVKAAVDAINKQNFKHQGMEEVLAIVEVNNCFSDGIQYVTGCSFGNNSLIYKDLGKTAFMLTKRDQKGIRYVFDPNSKNEWIKKHPEYDELFEKVIKNRSGSKEDKKKYLKLSRKISFELIQLDAENFFKIEETEVEIPELAPIYKSIECEECGENVMASKTTEKEGKELCLDCADENYFELNGEGIQEK